MRPCAGQCHKHELQDKAQSGPVSPVVAHGGFGHIPRGGVTQEHGSWTFQSLELRIVTISRY